MGTAAVLQSDRWDEVLLENILGNFRTTGIYGFRGGCLHNPTLLKQGWQHYHRAGRSTMPRTTRPGFGPPTSGSTTRRSTRRSWSCRDAESAA